MLKKIFNSSIIVALSDMINRGVLFVFSIIIARIISPDEFALYALTISIGIWMWSVADLGLTGHGIRVINQTPPKNHEQLVAKLFGTRIIVTIIVSVIASFIMLAVHIPYNEYIIYQMAVLYIIGMALFPAWVARALQDNIGYIIYYFTISFALLTGLLFVFDITLRAFDAILVRNVSWILGCLLAFILMHKRMMYPIKFGLTFGILKTTIPLGFAAILYGLVPLIPFLAVRYQDGDVSGYAIVVQIQQVLIVGSSVLATVFLPMFSKALYEKNNHAIIDLLKKFFIIIFLISTLISFSYWFFGAEVISFLYGDKYETAVTYLLPFSIALFFVFYRLVIDAALTSYGLYRKMAFSGICTVIIVLFLYAAFDFSLNTAWLYCVGEFLLIIFNSTFLYLTYLKHTARKNTYD